MIINNSAPEATMAQPTSNSSVKSDSQQFRQFAEGIARDLGCASSALLTTLPRGGLQVMQPQRVADSFLKPFMRDWQYEDDAAWNAIVHNKPVRGSSSSAYATQFLSLFGYAHYAAAPVIDPSLPGYMGAIEVHRTAEQGAFTADDLEKLAKAASQFGTVATQIRDTRGGDDAKKVQHRARHALFAMNKSGEVVLFPDAFKSLDDRIQGHIVQEAKKRLHKFSDDARSFTRLQLPDEAGDLITINVIPYRSLPALQQGPIAFFCLLPSCPDWGCLRSGDFQADPELSRLIPTMKFMETEFHRGPTLGEISRVVHLSPFHFHRRFTELFGLTPKHFLLECQIFDAKAHLLGGDKELAKIASDCGFAHQSHFTSRFKQATGLTPTRWRRMAADRNGR